MLCYLEINCINRCSNGYGVEKEKIAFNREWKVRRWVKKYMKDGVGFKWESEFSEWSTS